MTHNQAENLVRDDRSCGQTTKQPQCKYQGQDPLYFNRTIKPWNYFLTLSKLPDEEAEDLMKMK